jgi:hypothetical protein
MRYPVIALALFVCPTLATAGPTGGNGGGGGRLGDVSGGLRGPGGPGRSQPSPAPSRGTDSVVYAPVVVATATAPVVVEDGVVVRRVKPPLPDWGPSRIEGYAGAQRVHESEGAWHLELGVRDRVFGLRGQLTRYFEEQPGGSNLTLTMPALIASARISEPGPTRVYLEAGVIGARTRNDPVADSSYAGGIGGIRLEHRMTRSASVLGEAHAMMFEDGVRAQSARVGVTYDVLQLSVRVLDFSVGPALYGPELGLKF